MPFHVYPLLQAEMAKKINVTQADLSKMESGKRPIGKVIAKRIAKIFGVNYRYFL
jgi:transcriptional regulator with XRE-family HTH domain